MRTTVTLDPDVAARLHDRARRTGEPFKVVLNDAIRRGLAGRAPAPPFVVEPHQGGFQPGVDLRRLNQLIDELEVDEFVDECGPR